MKQELQNKLFERFPSIFKDVGCSPMQSPMAFGIECGDGWYDLIYDLCEKLEPYPVYAVQVKEKFGGLRFYIESEPDEGCDWEKVHNEIDKAEELSERTCEACGSPGKRTGKGWIVTLCKDCEEKRYGVSSDINNNV